MKTKQSFNKQTSWGRSRVEGVPPSDRGQSLPRACRGDARDTCKQVVDRYFLEHRARLIDIAAFLDRVDRAGGTNDYRIEALIKALDVLSDGRANRAARILAIFSDDSTGLTQSAEGVKSATGAAKVEEID